jgi:hypothetical protein
LSEAKYKPAEAPQSGNNGKIKKVLIKTKSTLDITKAQQELESLWMTLKMPVDQKMDMAIKYGSFKFAPKLETVRNSSYTPIFFIISLNADTLTF